MRCIQLENTFINVANITHFTYNQRGGPRMEQHLSAEAAFIGAASHTPEEISDVIIHLANGKTISCKGKRADAVFEELKSLIVA